MYTEIITDLKNRIAELTGQIIELDKKREQYKKGLEAIRKLQAEEDAKAGKLAVQRGICPFPNDCNEREYCTRDWCNADTCDDGRVYRRS